MTTEQLVVSIFISLVVFGQMLYVGKKIVLFIKKLPQQYKCDLDVEITEINFSFTMMLFYFGILIVIIATIQFDLQSKIPTITTL